MPTRNDPFEVLALERGASREQVRKRYRELARRYHPDVNKGETTSEWMFKQVNEAHEAIVGGASQQQRQSPPRPRPPEPPARREPTRPSYSTPAEPVDNSPPWILLIGSLAAVAAGHVAGALARATGFDEDLAMLLGMVSGTTTTPGIAAVSVTLATTTVMCVVLVMRDKAPHERNGRRYREALVVLKALAYTATAATLGSATLTMIARYAAQ